ncbi:hypothetical protein [Salinisphaera sp. T31B1]|uniref:hypothetical protein n=1 Tax=Salinisphaera sp. T31B1 TaxID=727963 RepID=UPI0033400E0A
MSRARPVRWLCLAVAVSAIAVAVWQGVVWFDHGRDNRLIRAALTHQAVEIGPDESLAVLFAQGYGETRLDRFRQAGAAYQTVWIRTDGGRHDDPEGWAARSRYNLGNLYARRAVAAAETFDVDGARTLAELAKQAYRDALRAWPDYWQAKHNFEAAQRLVRDLPQHEGEPEEGEKPAEDVWSQMPGFPRGLP